MLMWYKDGRLREYEAWSCDDVDSVHNDYQRHLLCVSPLLRAPCTDRWLMALQLRTGMTGSSPYRDSELQGLE